MPEQYPSGRYKPGSRKGKGGRPKGAKAKKHPINLESYSITERRTPEMVEWINTLRDEIESSHNATTEIRDRHVKFYKKRYGMWGDKSWPWPGCSNIHLPLIDKVIEKTKAEYVSLVLGSRPVCNFEPMGMADEEKVAKVEAYYDYRFFNHVKPIREIYHSVDTLLQKGWSYAKVVYDYRVETERQTYSFTEFPEEVQKVFDDKNAPNAIKLDFVKAQYRVDDEIGSLILIEIMKGARDKIVITVNEQVVKNAPKLVIREPEDVDVPFGVDNIQDAPWICDRGIWLTKDELADYAATGKYDKAAVTELLALRLTGESAEKESTEYNVRREREGFLPENEKKDLFNIWEVNCYYDYNGDGHAEKCIITFVPEMPEYPLRFIAYPFNHPKLRWNWVKFDREITTGRYNESRGLAEVLDVFQTEIVTLHNQKLDHNTIVNAPMLKMKALGGLNPLQISYAPGEIIPVTNPDDLQPVYQPSHEMSYEREEMILKGWAEERVGIPDFTMMSQTAASSRRTAREITKLSMEQNKQFNMYAQLFQSQWADVHYLIYTIDMQYGPEELYVRVMVPEQDLQPEAAMPQQFSMMGSGQNQVGRRYVRMRKAELTGDFDIIPNGNPGTSSPIMEEQKKMMDLQMFMGHPLVDQYKLLLRYMVSRDWRMAKELLKNPTQIMQERGSQQQQEFMGQGQKQAAASTLQFSPMEGNV